MFLTNMSTLNLLPEHQKNRLARERTFLIAHTVIGAILVAVTVSAMVLTVARISLITEYNKIKHDTTLVNVEHLSLENNIDDLNRKINTASKVQENFSKWSEILLSLGVIVPNGVELNYLYLSRAAKTFRLNGHAQNRDALLAAKAAFTDSPYVAKLEAPLSNLLEKSNIEFRFTGELSAEAFAVK